MISTIQIDGASRIDERLVRHLNLLAADCSSMGLELFVFGSVAQTYPRARKGADLDLGICAKDDMPREVKMERMRYAKRQIDQLPTIRPVELVDFDLVGIDFKELALRSRLEFPLVEHGLHDAKST